MHQLLAADTRQANISSFAFHPNNQDLAIADQNGSVTIRNIKIGAANIGFVAHYKERIDTLSFSPNGKRLATVGEDKIVKLGMHQTSNNQQQ